MTSARKISSPAALKFLVAALDQIENRSEQEVTQIAAEAALKGSTGLDLESAEKIHVISAFGSERFSGLELLCLMFAAFQRVKPGADVGADFSEIWQAALEMHRARRR